MGTPTFSPSSGTYSTNVTVTLSVATSGAMIHYTVNGGEPTESDPSVASGGSVVVGETQTLGAKAFKADTPSSAIASATYTMRVGTPWFTPGGTTYTSPQSVLFNSVTPGVTYYYTTDGSTPTVNSAPYTGPVSTSTSTVLKAIGVKAAWDNSLVASATYTMNFGTLAAPAIAPAGGTYEGSVTVSMSAQEGATIRYTTNGTTPTTNSPAYSGPFTLTTTALVKAKAFHPDYATSAEASASYTIMLDAPVISLQSGTHAPGTAITVSSSDPGATLRFTLDGADPTSASPAIVSGGTLLVGQYTLKARAFKTGAVDSAVASATYSLTTPYGGGVVASGLDHNIIATPQGLAYVWGSNWFNQLGDGTTTNRLVPTLVPVTGVTAAAGGQGHTLVATADGRLLAWGANWYGQLGDGTTTNRTRPIQIGSLSGVIGVAAGETHSLAVTAAGAVYAWGQNANGQLGLGSTTNQSTPTPVPGLSNVVAIAAGRSHSIALTADGRVFTWGYNWWGQVGDGSTTDRLSPVEVALTGIVDVAAGGDKSVVVAADGRVFVWGDIKIDTGTSTVSYVPFAVPSVQATEIAAGRDHTLAARADGVVLAWGVNSSGQLGDTTTVNRWSPVVVSGLTNAADVAGGVNHSIAVTKDGHVWSWGYGGAGQLGDGTTGSRPAPQDVFTAGGVWGRTPTPTVDVAPGVYHEPQTVVVSNLRTDAVMRYTTNGAIPTESDPIIENGGTVAVTTPTTLGIRAWSPDQQPSRVLTAVYDLRPATPAMTPPGGFYPGAQTVSITTATTASTIHYTLDGTGPTDTSPVYTDPIPVGTAATLRARAFRTGWSPSEIATAVYAFDPTAPVISAQVSPAPAGSGWNTTDVTVTFTCSDSESPITFCTPPQSIVGEQAARPVIGRAVNAAGLTTSLTVAVNIDTSDPMVGVSAPEEGEVFPPSTTSVVIRGWAIDSASGVQSVACGAVTAAVTDQAFACAVPVVEGTNTVTILATDGVGKTASAEIDILVGPPPAATSISISPARFTMMGGDTRELRVTDNRNRVVSGGTWTVDQPLVAQVEETGGVITVRALAPGAATVSVARDGLTAQAVVTVLAAESSIPSGTTLWGLGGEGSTPPRGEVLRAAPPEDFDPEADPVLFFVDEGTESYPDGLVRRWNRPTRIRATTADGRELWDRQFTDRTPQQVAADTRGGLVFLFKGEVIAGGSYRPPMIRRVSGRTGATSWEYVMPGGGGTFSEVALHPEGWVFVTASEGLRHTSLVGIDPTGSPRQWLLTPGHYYRVDSGPAQTTDDGPTQPDATGPIVLEDGSVVLYGGRDYSTSYVHCNRWENGQLECTHDYSRYECDGVQELYELRSFSAPTLTVHPFANSSGDCSNTYLTRDVRLLPDGTGGLLVAHRNAPWVGRLYTDDGLWYTGGAVDLLPITSWPAYRTEYVLGEDGAYALMLTCGAGGPQPCGAMAIHFDPVTLSVLSSTGLRALTAEPAQLQLRFALAGGGVYISGGSEAYAVNAAVDAGAFGAGGNATQIAPGLWTGWSTGPALAEGGAGRLADTMWAQSRGSAGQDNAARRTHGSHRDAAVTILRQITWSSMLARREFGGRICQLESGRFFATEPERLAGDTGHVWSSQCPSVAPAVATYHTHVGLAPQDEESFEDRFNHATSRLVGYIGVSTDTDWTKKDPTWAQAEEVDCRPRREGNLWQFAMKSLVEYEFKRIIACVPLMPPR